MDKTIELVNAIKDIQAMPSVIVRVLNVMKKPTVSMKELGDIVVYDQSLTIKILALVNSAYYGFSQQISSISIALSLLGMVKVKNIIVAVAMKPMMSNAGDKELWKHSIRVAAGCEYLAKLTKIMDADEAFIAGFIHDVGKIVLHTTNPKLYDKVVTKGDELYDNKLV
jgi:HD-like signal output (HDOD) protein